MASVRWVLPCLIGFAAVVLAAPAGAQGNLDAGKSPAKIFADTCAACHRSARELRQAGAGFLRSHYTTGPDEASVMANYLANPGGDPRPQRQSPSSSATQSPALPSGQANRQQPKSAQVPAGVSKKGRPDPKAATATITTDVKLPDPPPPPPPPELQPAHPAPVLEPFEE